MVTFKQLEAIFWVVQLGGFSQAANKLRTTQSAVSKRVHELETLCETALFDRSLRSARLTEKGEEMFLFAKRLLEQRDAGFEQFHLPEVLERRVRIGVTELTALTWLPRLVSAIQVTYPRVVIEPNVDASANLRDKLLADEIELMIAPDVYSDQRFVATPVRAVEHAWMCKPGLLGGRRRFSMRELAEHRLLIQDNSSGPGQIYSRWLKTIGVDTPNTLTSSSLVALIGLTISGLGISYLPKRCFAPMVESGLLQVLTVTPSLPLVPYAAISKADRPSSVVSSIATLAQNHCNFEEIFKSA